MLEENCAPQWRCRVTQMYLVVGCVSTSPWQYKQFFHYFHFAATAASVMQNNQHGRYSDIGKARNNTNNNNPEKKKRRNKTKAKPPVVNGENIGKTFGKNRKSSKLHLNLPQRPATSSSRRQLELYNANRDGIQSSFSSLNRNLLSNKVYFNK